MSKTRVRAFDMTHYLRLSGERVPNADTLFKVMRAMGFKLSAQPVKAA